MAFTFRCQHKVRSAWDTHPSCVMCRIHNSILSLGQNPCHFCASWDDKDWASQDIHVDKIRRDWETGLKQIQQTPALTHSHTQLTTSARAISTSSLLLSGSSAVGPLVATNISTQSEPVADLPLSISRQSLDKALSMTQSWQRSRPSRRPVSATGLDLSLSLNTLKHFEAAASLRGPIQPEGQRKSSLPRPILKDSQEEILVEVMEDSSPLSSANSLESRAEEQGVHSGSPGVSQSGLLHPGSWGGVSWQDPKSQDSMHGLVTPKRSVIVSEAQVAARFHLPISISMRKSGKDVPAMVPVVKPRNAKA